MNEDQFCELMGKLEEIRCGIVDVEDNTVTKGKDAIGQIRATFFHQLEAKTGWGRDEIKNLFDTAVKNAV